MYLYTIEVLSKRVLFFFFIYLDETLRVFIVKILELLSDIYEIINNGNELQNEDEYDIDESDGDKPEKK